MGLEAHNCGPTTEEVVTGLAWLLLGNAGTNPTNNFLGTTDAVDLRLATNSSTVLRFIQSTNAIQREDGGNARGARALDLQVIRAGVSQVASGADSALIVSRNSTASGVGSLVIGGQNNNSSEADGVIIGGGSNTNSGSGAGASVIISGTSQTISASGSLNSIIGGTANTVSGATTAAVIIGGQLNTVSIGSFQLIIGSFNCATNNTLGLGSIIASTNSTMLVNAQLSTILNGTSCTNDGLICGVLGGSGNVMGSGTACTIVNGGSNSVSNGVFGATIVNGFGSTASLAFQTLLNGISAPSRPLSINWGTSSTGTASDMTTELNQMSAQTTDATSTELQIQPSIVAAQGFTVPVDAATSVDVQVVAKSDVGDVASWHFTVLVDDNAGVLALISPAGAIAPTHNTAGTAAAWTITPAALTVPNRIGLTAVGTAATNVRWNANLRVAEVVYT